MLFSKKLGCILMIAGTAIGGGMLAIPLVTAPTGFAYGFLALLACWALMTYTAFITLELHLTFSPETDFSSMALQTLGKSGQILTWVTYLLLLYSLLAAYISGGASALLAGFETFFHRSPSPVWLALGFTIVLGSFVTLGIRSIDRLNRILILIKVIAFFLSVLVMLPHLHLMGFETLDAGRLPATLPIIITAFGFHIIIPTVRRYLGDEAQELRQVVFIGGLIPLVIYFIWLVVTLGLLPPDGPESFHMINSAGGSLSNFILALTQEANSHWVSFGINAFSNVAVTTSFLGVSAGLFAFLSDGFRLNLRDPLDKAKQVVLAYLPPLVFALFYPQGFIKALGYGSVLVSILLIILPPLMLMRRRQQLNQQASNLGLHVSWVMGIGIIALQVFPNG